MNQNKKIIIGWLYPEFMNTYGDRGNILILTNRCHERNIDTEIRPISIKSDPTEIAAVDFLFMGGAQDRQQEIIFESLMAKKAALKKAIEKGIPGLYICGAYQLLGQYYITAQGKKIHGLGIFDLHTENTGAKRLIGNISIKAKLPDTAEQIVIGFENHGGQTFLGREMQAFGQITAGFGNSEHGGDEGAIYHNSIGTYLHGPVLAKNPELADWIIKKTLQIKYAEEITLEKIDDRFEAQARAHFIK
ncbi:MAG: cobalamin biosynthesis protein CobQ [Candidatus Berkelbacteria bacterium]